MDILSATSAASSSSNTASNFYNNNTVTGLVDGINVDNIVSGLMTSARQPEDTLQQQVQTLQWQEQDYQTINTDLQNLLSTASGLELQGSFLAKQATSSSSAVTATAGTATLDTSHSVAVTSMAANAVLNSQAPVAAITSAGSTLSSEGVATGSFTINDGTNQQTFNVTGTTTLTDVINAINSSGLNVQASWDSNLGYFYLNATRAGTTVTATDTGGGNLMQTLLGNGTNSASGTKAQVNIDGTNYTFNSNQFTVNGVSYSLAGLTGANNATVTVSDNTSAVVNTIQGFVTAYNNTLTDIHNMLTQPVYAGYTPLTQDDITAKGLDSTQVDAWNTKAQSGQLNNDQFLQSIMYDLQDAIANPVSGLTGQVTVTNDASQQVTATANQAAVAGLTASTSLSSYGQLTLNTDQLTQALQSNPQAVMALFTTSLNPDGSLITDSSQQGVGTRLFNTLTNSVLQLTDKAGLAGQSYDGSYIGQEIASDNTQISNWNNQLNNLEQHYYTEFDAMEQALSQMNTESSWLTEAFGSSSSS
jgi:flagellar hook-associated protein 2